MEYKRENILPGNPVRDFIRKGKKGKLGLVLEGGAMRGVTVAGSTLALEQLGLRDRFHALYGVSAGAITASYFAAGQSTWGTSVFYDDLLQSDFFSWKRALQNEAPMNVDFVLDVIRKRKPLDVDAVLRENVHIFASQVRSGRLVHWKDFSDREDLFAALRAAVTMPIIAGGPYRYRGGLYFDGGVHTSVPWKEALSDGCTHLLVLLSRPEDSPRPAASKIEKLLADNIFARKYPELVPSYLRRIDSYNNDLRELREKESEGAAILTVAPRSGVMPIGSFERKREPLLLGARQGAEALYEKLFGESPRFYEMLVSSEERGTPLWKESPRQKHWWRRS